MQLIELQQSTENEWDAEALSKAVGLPIEYLASTEKGAGWVRVALPDDVELTEELKSRLQSVLLEGKSTKEI